MSEQQAESEAIRGQAERAKAAARVLASAERAVKDRALSALARALRASQAAILAANEEDVARGRASGLADALVDRLAFGAREVEATARGVEFIAELPDPVGARRDMRRLPNGLLAGRQRLPLGVIAMIYESRPGVTVDAAALCLKAGNAVLLRGGKEAAATNRVLGELVAEALAEVGLPRDAVALVRPDSRDGVRALISLTGLVDLVIPRGGHGLIRFVTEHAKVPVVQHYQGVCHLYLDAGCSVEMAVALAVNSKSRVSVCNALECLLVDAADAERLLPPVAAALTREQVALRCCERAHRLVPSAERASDEDWGREFLDHVLAVRVVDGLDGALAHIARYGSNHTEALCTERYSNAERFVREVDASCVLVNASTRFNDGGQLGLGAEIGISTSKLHAYGPMGLEHLTTEKWVVYGSGQVRG